MSSQLRWKIPFTTSCLHAADGAARGQPIVDPRLAAAVAAPTARLKSIVEASGVPPGRLWRHLAALSGATDSSRQIAETALAKTIGRVERFEIGVGALAGAIAELQAAVRLALPNLTDELALRERPLREQWEARGPGLLGQLALLTQPGLLPEQADVLLVHPAFGGAGAAHLSSNAMRIEAVLANPHADLPEIVRLAWLVAQLELDLPRLSENIHADRLPHVARLAMLPAVLKSAELVDLVHFSPELITRALQAWHVALPPGTDGATVLGDWWATYELDRPPLRVAIEALDQMLG